jgi:hypothetical protein
MHIREKKMILHTCKPTSGFFNLCNRKKEMILHICKFTNGFFSTHIGDKIKWYFPLVGLQVVFLTHIGGET